MLNILHLTSQWPNIIYPNSGIFVKNTVQNLAKYTSDKYFVLNLNKILNKVYLKEERFKPSAYLKFLLNHGFYEIPDTIRFFRMLYPPVMGITEVRGYNAYMCWNFNHLRLKRLVKKNGIDLIHAHFFNPDGFVAYKLKIKYKIPYVMHVHGEEVQGYESKSKNEKEILHLIYDNADYIICNSNKTKRLLKQLLGIEDKVKIVAFGIDNIEKRNKTDLHSPLEIITVSNLVKIKGVQYSLEALASLSGELDFKFTIIGYGPMYNELMEQTKKLLLSSKVVFMGRQTHKVVMEKMKSADIFLMPSYNEAFGIVYLEALSKGITTIGTKGQGCEDINNYLPCLYLVEPQNAVSIKNVILDILSNDKKRIEYIENGYKVLEKFYSWKNIASETYNVYKKIL